MSFSEREKSAYSGQPQMLYRFSVGESLWLYTSADVEVVYGAETYQPVFFIRGGRFTRGGDTQKSTIDIEIAASNPLALAFRSGWVGGIMVVTIYRHHHNDADFSIQWKGRVTGCKWKGSTATLTSDSVFTMFKRAGLRRVYQVGCPHSLFGPGCNLSQASYATAATVAGVSGNTVVTAAAGARASGYYTGGMLRFGNEYRMIIAHSGTGLVLLDGMAGIAAGSAITIWPGCARNMDACINKFGNLDNYGGLPFLPASNPFGGSDALV